MIIHMLFYLLLESVICQTIPSHPYPHDSDVAVLDGNFVWRREETSKWHLWSCWGKARASRERVPRWVMKPAAHAFVCWRGPLDGCPDRGDPRDSHMPQILDILSPTRLPESFLRCGGVFTKGNTEAFLYLRFTPFSVCRRCVKRLSSFILTALPGGLTPFLSRKNEYLSTFFFRLFYKSHNIINILIVVGLEHCFRKSSLGPGIMELKGRGLGWPVIYPCFLKHWEQNHPWKIRKYFDL